jgi:hypothetical protein
MQDHDVDADRKVSNYYGVLPGIAGLLFAGGLTWLMFALADGFT